MTLLRRRLAWLEPAVIAEHLVRIHGEDGLIWLDGDGSELGHHITLAVDPLEQHCCRGLPGDPGATNPFTILRQLRGGHWTGWLSYDAAAWTEPGNPWRRDVMATLWIARHDPVLRFDLKATSCAGIHFAWRRSTSGPQLELIADLERQGAADTYQPRLQRILRLYALSQALDEVKASPALKDVCAC